MLMQANKLEKIEISEGSNHSNGAFATSQTCTKLEKDYSPPGNCKHEQRHVSLKDIVNVQELLELKHKLWKYNNYCIHQF